MEEPSWLLIRRYERGWQVVGFAYEGGVLNVFMQACAIYVEQDWWRSPNKQSLQE
jgi:hypothetical protein